MASTKQFDTTLEGALPMVQQQGLNTNKNTFLGGTVEVKGVATFDSSMTVSGPITSVATGTFASPLVVGSGQVIVGALHQIAGPTGVSAPTGSIFLSYSGGTGPATRAFINSNGATGWIAITTAS